MGLDGLLTFTKMLNEFSVHNYNNAANELLNSKWAKEVHQQRANDISTRIKTGTY
jgi:hypothetical protein